MLLRRVRFELLDRFLLRRMLKSELRNSRGGGTDDCISIDDAGTEGRN